MKTSSGYRDEMPFLLQIISSFSALKVLIGIYECNHFIKNKYRSAHTKIANIATNIWGAIITHANSISNVKIQITYILLFK